MCCGSPGLAAGAAMCRDCLYSHGFKGGVCDKQTRDEIAQVKAIALVDVGQAKARISDAARKRAQGMQL